MLVCAFNLHDIKNDMHAHNWICFKLTSMEALTAFSLYLSDVLYNL